jgi:putative aldouronate transport system permease protein
MNLAACAWTEHRVLMKPLFSTVRQRSLAPIARPPAGRWPRRDRGGRRASGRNRIAADIHNYILLLPAFLYTLVFGYVTLPYLFTAFQKYSYTTGLFTSRWVGFDNFRFFFQTSYAAQVTWNTVRLNFLFILIGTVVAVLLAVLLKEIPNRPFMRITQSLFILPFFISWVIASYFIYDIFSTDYGVANQVLRKLGLSPVNWYSVPQAWTWILVVLRVWKFTGYQVVIYLATITGIDSHIF